MPMIEHLSFNNFDGTDDTHATIDYSTATITFYNTSSIEIDGTAKLDVIYLKVDQIS